MKRNAIVILVLIAGIMLMVWSGARAVHQRRVELQNAEANHVPLVPDSATPSDATSQAAADSPEAEGLPDLRGKQAPGFTLKTPEGKTVSLADYKGQAVLVNFWATWCAPCKIEMPWLIDLQKQYASRGFTILGISEDDPPFAGVAGFVAKNGMNYPVLLSNDDVSKSYGGIDALPTSYYVGRDGKVLFETAGLISKSEMESNIQKILATKGA